MKRFVEETLSKLSEVVYEYVLGNERILNLLFENPDYRKIFSTFSPSFRIGYNNEQLKDGCNVVITVNKDETPKDESYIGGGGFEAIGEQRHVLVTRKSITMAVISQSELDTIVMSHFLRWMLVAFQPILAEEDVNEIEIDMEDVKIPEMLENNVYLRGLTINFRQEIEVPDIDESGLVDIRNLIFKPSFKLI